MSEELLKKDLFGIFAASQETYQEAEEKAKQEAGEPKVERFRVGDDGDYLIRILPIAPKFDKEGNVLPLERKGYEYPLHQLFLKIDLPTKDGKKPKSINVPVVRSTEREIGFSVDLIDTYVKIAKEIYYDDDKLMEKIKNTNFSGGLRWSFIHCIYVLDLNDKRKGPMLWQPSHAQYRQLDSERMRVWTKLKQRDPNARCPISNFVDAYPVIVSRKSNGPKTEYHISLETLDDKDDLTQSELQALIDAPRIDEYVYRFSRYHMEAELEFLRQYDEINGIEICKEPDFIEAVETLKAELPADDTRHFDIGKISKEEAENKGGVDTVESLWNEYDALVDSGANERSAEYKEFMEKIRSFIEVNNLDMRVSRSATASQLLEKIEELLKDKETKPVAAPKQDVQDVPEPESDAEPEPVVEEVKEEEPAEEPEKPVTEGKPSASTEENNDGGLPRRRRRLLR